MQLVRNGLPSVLSCDQVVFQWVELSLSTIPVFRFWIKLSTHPTDECPESLASSAPVVTGAEQSGNKLQQWPLC